MSDLIYGWGNDGFSAREEFLRACLRHALAQPGSILECGSGLTTILVGAMLEQSGGSMWSLEHDEFWHRRAQKALDRFRIRSVDLFHAPLTNYGDYSWYGVTGSLLPNSISLVICDGPPSGTPGGGMVRYHLCAIGCSEEPWCFSMTQRGQRSRQ
jgi:hypothetical protein